MSTIGGFVKRVFGHGGDSVNRAEPSSINQARTETLAVGTTNRKIKGPQKGGHYSLFMRVTEASGGASTVTVWYSNLPNPDETTDNDWVQDTDVGSLSLSATGNTFKTVGNVFCEWVRFKAVVATDSADAYLWARVEGTDV